MIKAKSLKIFHKILNFVILGLAIVVFILMVRLIKNEYFTNKDNKDILLALTTNRHRLEFDQFALKISQLMTKTFN